MLAEAQQRRQSVLDDLERERISLDQAIAQLRAFEQDYRGRLRGFIEGQLNQLAATGGVLEDAVQEQDRASAEAGDHVLEDLEPAEGPPPAQAGEQGEHEHQGEPVHHG